MTVTPLLTCVLTASGDDVGDALQSLDALLALEAEDIEVVLVDHGLDDATHDLLRNRSFPRLRLLRMAPAPRASARNRGMAHARGQRLCVLNPGDTLTPFTLSSIRKTDADCLFLPGICRDTNGLVHPGPGQAVFDWLVGASLESADTSDPRFSTMASRLALLPPLPGRCVVRRDFVQRHNLAFAYEGASSWLFVTGVLMNADSLALADLPSVVHCRERAPHEADAITVLNDAAQALSLMQRARHFQDPALRLALLGAVFHQLHGFEAALSPDTRRDFRNACALVLARSDPRLIRMLAIETRRPITDAFSFCAPWLGDALDYAQELSELLKQADEPERMPRQSAIARLSAWRWGRSRGS